MKKFWILVAKILIVACVISLFITFYQYVGHLVIDGSLYLLQGHIGIFVLTIVIALAASIGLIYVNKLLPGYYGSGIPQIEAYHRGWYKFSPYKMIGLIILNSFFAFFGGFLLGSEGPSISIGSSIGMISNQITKDEDKDIVACGGSAGFACAFMSPLAGLCHLIEENKKMLSWKLILKGIFIIGISYILCYFLYDHSLLPYFEVDFLPFKYYWVLLPLILLSVGLGKLYMYLIVKTKDLTKGKKIMMYLTPLLLITFMILRRFHPILVGNGGSLLDTSIIDYSLIIIFGILLFRLIGTALSVSSNVSGGVVLPMLAVGALSAELVVKAYSLADSSILPYSAIFIICGMLIVFAVVTKAPLTSMVLGLKCAPLKVIVLPLILVITLSMIFVYVFKWDNIYHQLEKRLPGFKEEYLHV